MTEHTHHDHDRSECRRLLSSLSDYVDGELDDALCQAIEAHMAECENCRIVVNTLTRTVELYHTAPAPDLPQDVRLRLYKTLRLEDFIAGEPPDAAEK